MSDLYHGEYPVDMTPAEAARELQTTCKHPTKISACGIKVCMDCGAPLNAKAKALAWVKRS